MLLDGKNNEVKDKASFYFWRANPCSQKFEERRQFLKMSSDKTQIFDVKKLDRLNCKKKLIIIIIKFEYKRCCLLTLVFTIDGRWSRRCSTVAAMSISLAPVEQNKNPRKLHRYHLCITTIIQDKRLFINSFPVPLCHEG